MPHALYKCATNLLLKYIYAKCCQFAICNDDNNYVRDQFVVILGRSDSTIIRGMHFDDVADCIVECHRPVGVWHPSPGNYTHDC